MARNATTVQLKPQFVFDTQLAEQDQRPSLVFFCHLSRIPNPQPREELVFVCLCVPASPVKMVFYPPAWVPKLPYGKLAVAVMFVVVSECMRTQGFGRGVASRPTRINLKENP